MITGSRAVELLYSGTTVPPLEELLEELELDDELELEELDEDELLEDELEELELVDDELEDDDVDEELELDDELPPVITKLV
jgi:uncharacterized protein (DUF849 family)